MIVADNETVTKDGDLPAVLGGQDVPGAAATDTVEDGPRRAEGVEGGDDRLVEEGDVAGDYLERLLDILDFDGDIDLDVEGDRAMISIEGGDDLKQLVGRKGEVLDALQELSRLAVQQVTGERSRLMLDVSRWRADRRAELSSLGTEVARRVRTSGQREALNAMTPFERKIVHDAVATVDGVVSESEGTEPARKVVVLPAE